MKDESFENDLGKLLSSGDNYDVILEAGENENVKIFYTHSSILSSRSTYFKSALSKNWAHKENEKIIFRKPNITPETMELLLKYIYTGTIDLNMQKGSEILKLFIASDELNFGKLNGYIESFIIEKQINQMKFLNEDPIGLLKTVLQYESLTDLRDPCLQFFSNNSEILFESSEFLTMDKSFLILFVQRNDLNMKEYEIWENILKWGNAQMSDSVDIKNIFNWTKGNFIELEKILHDIIPLIRWFQIPSTLFHTKIKPFKMILPKILYEDIVGYYMDPNLPPKSTILLEPRKPSFRTMNRTQFARISSLIDRVIDNNNYNIGTYSFELLYRASRDGFDSIKFHNLCNNRGPTLMIAKIKDTGKLIGGYNPESWKIYKFYAALENSFIFSFTNQDDIGSPIVATYKHTCRLLDMIMEVFFSTELEYNSNGPIFGKSSDLTIENNIIECNSTHSYPEISSIIDIGQKFLMEDYEVFKVRKLNKLVAKK